MFIKGFKENSSLREYKQNQTVQKIIKRIEVGLKNGEIVILIDSFDELSRMSFQTEVFKKIFQISKKYICASRPRNISSNLHKHTSVKNKVSVASADNKKIFRAESWIT